MGKLIVYGHLQQRKHAPKEIKLAKVGSKFGRILNKPSNFTKGLKFCPIQSQLLLSFIQHFKEPNQRGMDKSFQHIRMEVTVLKQKKPQYWIYKSFHSNESNQRRNASFQLIQSERKNIIWKANNETSKSTSHEKQLNFCYH